MGLLLVSIKTFDENFLLVVRSLNSAFCSSSKTAHKADFGAHVKEKDVLGGADILLEIHGLIDGSGEAVN